LSGTLFFYLGTREKHVTRLRESEEKFRSLSDNALTGIMQINRKGEFLYANNALIKLLGYRSINEIKGENFNKIFSIPGEMEMSLKNMASGTSIVNWKSK
jgi:PAS domain S-box-containing protein